MRRLLVLLFLLPLEAFAQGAGTPPYRGVNNWNLIFGTDNVFDIGATSSQRPRTGYFGTSVVTPALTVSGLTSTRVPVAGVGGALGDFSTLTFNSGTGVLSATGLTVTGSVVVPAGTAAAGVNFGTAGTGLCSAAAASAAGLCVAGSEMARASSGSIFYVFANTMTAYGVINIGVANDVGFARQAAGVVRVTNGSTSTRALLGGGASVASATALPVPAAGLYHVTGTTTITSITSTNIGTGTCVTLIFDGVLTFTDGSNLKLAGDFATTADDTISLCYDGSNWYETHRSIN